MLQPQAPPRVFLGQTGNWLTQTEFPATHLHLPKPILHNAFSYISSERKIQSWLSPGYNALMVLDRVQPSQVFTKLQQPGAATVIHPLWFLTHLTAPAVSRPRKQWQNLHHSNTESICIHFPIPAADTERGKEDVCVCVCVLSTVAESIGWSLEPS